MADKTKITATVQVDRRTWTAFRKKVKELDMDASKTIRRWIREFLQGEKS
jgi:hypothetical protein